MDNVEDGKYGERETKQSWASKKGRNSKEDKGSAEPKSSTGLGRKILPTPVPWGQV